MRFTPAGCGQEIHSGKEPGGILLRGDVSALQAQLLAAYAGQVQTVYLDPPFGTGKPFVLRQRCGEAGWLYGKPTVALPAYTDPRADDADYHAMLRTAVETAHALLRDDGSIFVHIDARMNAQVRLLLDEIFGAKGFTNEIIWTYQSGGRSLKHFSRKHDTILYYRKTPAAYFNIRAVGLSRAKSQSNHMRRAVDDDGRAYRSIVSQGKEYRYYDDEPVFPSDVWDDVSHLQQKDPQRTGYDSQKPIRLLERILLSTTRPGDLVCDLFAGSGTTAAAAALHGRRFLSMDASDASLAVMRKRLLGYAMRIEAETGQGAPRMAGQYLPGLGLAQVRLDAYALEEGLCELDLPGIEAVDQLSVGYLRDGAFIPFDQAARTKLTPALPPALELPMLDGIPAMLTVDVLGRRLLHRMEVDANGE